MKGVQWGLRVGDFVTSPFLWGVWTVTEIGHGSVRLVNERHGLMHFVETDPKHLEHWKGPFDD